MSRGSAKTLAALTDALGGDAGVKDALARAGKLGKKPFLAVLERDIDLSIRELESNAQHHLQSSEDLMSRMIVGFLKAKGYNATSDENERGHVDILVKSTKLNLKWASEAKIHGAYDHALEGIKQLVTRYASGFDDHGGFVLYVRVAGAADVAKEFRKRLEAEPTCETVRTLDEAVVFRFRSIHRHSSGIEYNVRHHVVLMHHEPKDKSAQTRVSP